MRKYFTVLFVLLSSTLINAQSFELNADLVSRYIWRGLEAAPGASIQPNFAYNIAGFNIGVWASYSLSPQAAGADENDFWLSYGKGAFTVILTDYYYPSGVNPDIFDFSDKGLGAHVPEITLAYSGGKDLPLDIMLAANIYNDIDNSIYLEFTWHSASGLDVIAGITRGPSAWYAVQQSGVKVINIGLKYSKELKITSDFNLPLSGQLIFNPTSKRSFLVFGISL